MNDLIKNKEQTWNSRLKKCIETKGYSQKQLAEDFNKRFHTKWEYPKVCVNLQTDVR